MIRHIDAIFSQDTFRPLEPVTMPEGTRVHLSVEEGTELAPAHLVSKIRTPRLAHSKDAVDFVLEVRGTDDASL